jgi:Fe2+ transport system protein B
MQEFNELVKNKKDELFENSIQAYVQYPEEIKQKLKKVAVKIISHAWRSYKSKLMKIWRDQDTLFRKYKDLSKENWARFVEKYESENFVANS